MNTTLEDYGIIPDRSGVFDYLIKRRPKYETMVSYAKQLMNDCRSCCAMNITFRPEYHLFTETELRHLVISALNSVGIKNYVYFPDVDDNGNFHYHGVAVVDLKMRPKIKRFFTLKVGFIKFAYLSDNEGWFKYMRKKAGFESVEHPVPLEQDVFTDDEIRVYGICSIQTPDKEPKCLCKNIPYENRYTTVYYGPKPNPNISLDDSGLDDSGN